MKRNLLKKFLSAGLIVFVSGCWAVLQAQGGGSVTLSYNYPADKAVKYTLNSHMAQLMNVEGQVYQTDVTSAFGCQVKSAGKKDANLIIEVTVDTLGQTTESPMGGGGGSVNVIKGKSCNLVISPSGEIVDISEAENLVYNMEGSGEGNLSQTLIDFFPRLPVSAVKPGDTWNYTDSLTSKSAVMTMINIDSTQNKLEGFAEIDGIQCARISVIHNGTISMSVQSQGMEVYIKGPFTGLSECLFAVKEGYFVKMSTETTVKGNLDLPSMGMNMPITINMKSECIGR